MINDKDQQKLIIVTKGQSGIVENVVPFAIPPGETLEGVFVHDRELTARDDIIEKLGNQVDGLMKFISSSLKDREAVDARRTRLIVRRFGWTAIGLWVLAIGLVSFLVHAEERDMEKVDAIYQKLGGVQQSPFITGEAVSYKASSFDRRGNRMHATVLESIFPAIGRTTEQETLRQRMVNHDDYINCKGEMIDHWQNEHGVWYALVTCDGAFSEGMKKGFRPSLSRISFVLPESRLQMTAQQSNEVHKL